MRHSNSPSTPIFTDYPYRGWVLTFELANGDTLEVQVPKVTSLRVREGDLARNRVVLTGPDGALLGRSQFDSWRERFSAGADRRATDANE